MLYQKRHPISRLLSCTAMLICLTACDRETYTSWSCQSENEAKTSMVLRKAQMEFLGLKLKYCGSLGNQSFFDTTCTNQTEQSSTVFSPKTGLLVLQAKEYQCTAL
jgi:hypothetical protein